MKLSELEKVDQAAKKIFGELKKKHPELKGFLVLNSIDGQCELSSDPAWIVEKFPAAIIESKQKDKATNLMGIVIGLQNALKKQDAKRKQINEEINENLRKIRELAKDLEIYPTVTIEVRLEDLNYALLDLLRVDPLVDQNLTPQTRASIRIVLGAVEQLAERNPD